MNPYFTGIDEDRPETYEEYEARRANHEAEETNMTTPQQSVEEKYQELLMAVISKHEGETRHETALRYIQEAESLPTEETSSHGYSCDCEGCEAYKEHQV